MAGIRIGALAAALLAGLLLGACGNEGEAPGDSPPKRALDPRSEAIRYFPSSTDAVVLLQTANPEAMAALNVPMSKVPAWSSIRDRIAGSLDAAGIDPERILALSRNPADDIELPDPEIAYGVIPGYGPQEDRVLLVLATEQGVELDRIFKEAAESGRLEAAGEFDGARLYRGEDLDFAVRDGVLIAAPDLNRLQQAITRRDGDREDQLDDAPITALLNQLPENGTLRAYSGPRPPSEALLALVAGAIAEEKDLPTAVESAISVRGKAEDLAIDLAVKLEQADQLVEEDEEKAPRPDEEPAPVAITPAQIEAVLAGLPKESALRRLDRLGPLAGAAWIEGDLLRARLISTP